MIDENLSYNQDDADNPDEKKLKQAELIIENKFFKELDNRLREEHGDILLTRDQNGMPEIEEKHQVEQMVKEEKVAIIEKLSHDSHNVQYQSSQGQEICGSNLDVLAVQLSKLLKQEADGKTDSGGQSKDNDAKKLKLDTNIVQGAVQDKNLTPKAITPGKDIPGFESLGQVEATDEVEKVEKVYESAGAKEVKLDDGYFQDRVLEGNFQTYESIRDQQLNEQKDLDEVCNIDLQQDNLISRAAVTFAIMQTEEKTHTAADENVDENATRAAPYTVASQWAQSAFGSSSDNSGDETEGEDGTEWKIRTRKSKRALNTLADEDDLKLDSCVRNSLVFQDGEKESRDYLRNSLIFLDDDLNDSVLQTPGDLGILVKESVEKRQISVEKSNESTPTVKRDSEKPFSGSSSIQSKTSSPSKMPEKLAKDIGNLISSPLKQQGSPSKITFKAKESLTDIKKLASLSSQLKITNASKPPTPQPKKDSSHIMSDRTSRKEDKYNIKSKPPIDKVNLLTFDKKLEEAKYSKNKMSTISEESNGDSKSPVYPKSSKSVDEIYAKMLNKNAEMKISKSSDDNKQLTFKNGSTDNKQNDVKQSTSREDNRQIELKSSKSIEDNKLCKEDKVPSSSSIQNKGSSSKLDSSPSSKKSLKKRSSSASCVERTSLTDSALGLSAYMPVPPESDPSKLPKPPPGQAPKNAVVHAR